MHLIIKAVNRTLLFNEESFIDINKKTTGIRLTDRAISEAHTLEASNPEWAGLALRVYLEGKGCDGFFYGVTFDKPASEDLHFQQDSIDIVVDPDTIEYVDGSTIDWVDDERGKGFLVENPQHKVFRGKFFKRSSWTKKLETKIQNRQIEKTGVVAE